MIDNYNFGSITINNKDYQKDVAVYWSQRNPEFFGNSGPKEEIWDICPWDRKDNHWVSLDDIQEVLGQKPDIVVIATGVYGVSKIADDVLQELKNRKIKVFIDRTAQAVKRFNLLVQDGCGSNNGQRKVIGLFHLTC